MAKKAAAVNKEFAATFAVLKGILKKFEPVMVVQTDKPDNYYLNTTHICATKKPMFFACARIGKGYVSYHLMPVYCWQKLLDSMSEGLRKRMQGKSCFNFKTIDRQQAAELARLTEQGYRAFKKQGFA